MLHLWLGRLADLLYPPGCLAAGCPARGRWLCADHQAQITRLPVAICARCADVLPGAAPVSKVRGQAPPAPATPSDHDDRRVAPDAEGSLCIACAQDSPAFERVSAVGVYRGSLRDAVLALKYHRRQAAAPFLGGLIARECQSGAGADLVVAVPAHRARVAERGIDHARALGDGVATALGIAACPGALIRRRDTRPQVGLGAAQRRANVAEAFYAEPSLVAGRRVLLVDDVVTTGSTVKSASEALVAAGAASVVVACLARAAVSDHDR